MIYNSSKERVIQKINEDFGSTQLYDAIADYIRSYIWALCFNTLEDASLQPKPVNKRVVLNSARSSFFSLIDSSEQGTGEDFFFRLLCELIKIGDIVELPKGYIVPGPLRLIKTNEDCNYLLIGGAPTPYLKAKLNLKVNNLGLSRVIEHPNGNAIEKLGLPICNLNNWLEIPEIFDNMPAWYENYLTGLVFNNDMPYEENLFFLSNVGWRALEKLDKSFSGLQLCKIESKTNRYYLIKFSQGKILGGCEQNGSNLKMLFLFFINHSLNRPVQIRYQFVDEFIICEINYKNLPDKVLKFLSAFGYEKITQDKKTRWFFPRKGWPKVVKFLTWFGFQFVEMNLNYLERQDVWYEQKTRGVKQYWQQISMEFEK